MKKHPLPPKKINFSLRPCAQAKKSERLYWRVQLTALSSSGLR